MAAQDVRNSASADLPVRTKRKQGNGSNQKQAKRRRKSPVHGDGSSSPAASIVDERILERQRRALASGDSSSDISEIENELEDEDEKDDDDEALPADFTGQAESAAKHFRFGSEELSSTEIFSTAPETQSIPSGEDSDDEAPEDVSAAAASAKVKQAAEAAAKAVEIQKQDTKQRNRLKTERLQDQAKAARANHQSLRSAKDARVAGPVAESGDKSVTSGLALDHDQDDDEEDDAPVPLLPLDLLEEDFERPPTPPPALPAKKRQRTATASRASKLKQPISKDRKVGSVNVRVLQKSNKFLASKADPSRQRRDHWLQGRGTVKGIRKFERRPMNKGFTTNRPW